MRTETEQCAGRHHVLEIGRAVLGAHIDQLTTTSAEQFNDNARHVVSDFNMHVFNRFEHFARFGVFMEDNFRLADLELVTFTAHGLDQNAEMQFAAPADNELVRRFAIGHTQRHVAARLVIQTLAQTPRRSPTRFAFAPRER
jgi:hypothetical protein